MSSSEQLGNQASVDNQHPPERPTTFRVRGVPNDWGGNELKEFLTQKVSAAGLEVQSLAKEFHGRSQTATVFFENTNNPPLKIALPAPSGSFGKQRNLTLDDDFLGITSLFVPSQQDPNVNIIAMSGLGGHAFGSFKERGGKHMWLRDSLPYDITSENDELIASIMVYGYETSVPKSDSFQNLEDLGTELHSTLTTLAIDRTLKPIIFIAHSLGGLVLKQLLISLSKSEDEMDQRLRRAIYGIAFFGVPHEGMDIRSLIPMVGDGPNRFLLESIGSSNSQILSIQQREFSEALGGQGESEIFSFYETRMSPTAVMDKEGNWSMTGPRAILVSKSSATHCRYWENRPEHICAINRTHSEMVKFAEEDPQYNIVLGRIKKLAQRAIIARRSPLQFNLSPEEQECLKSLAFPQMHNRGNDIERAVEGTCKWLLQHKTYMSWAASHRGLLWLKGKPGAGKSTLLKYAFGKQRDIPSSTDSDLLLSFFFHGRGDALQKTPLGFFRSLLHQILKQAPNSLSDLVDTYLQRRSEMGNPPENWQWRLEELWCFFESSLLKTLKVRPIWLFVDALDECGEKDAVDLALKFKSLLESSRATIFESLHICFSCRHYPIPADLEGVVEICVEDQNKEDISTYVRNKISQCSVREASTIVDLISTRSSGIFMWARLVLERVLDLERERASWNEIEEEIRHIPPDMDSLYMDHVRKTNDRPAPLRLIQWICFAERPLSLIELYWALAIGGDDSHKSLHQCGSEKDYGNDNDMEKRVIALSCGLVESVQSEDGERVAQFIHQSVKDFFMDKGLVALDKSSTSPGVAIGMGHFQLAKTCTRYLMMEEIVQAATSRKEELFSRRRKELEANFPLLRYAATSLVAHLQQYDALDLPQECILEIFGWPSEVIVQQWSRVFLLVRQYSDKGPSRGGLLHVLAQFGILQPIIAILQGASHTSAKVDPKDAYGRTPLSWAAQEGHETVVKLLLGTGQVNVNSEDKHSRTPLSWAVAKGHEAVVKLLLDTGQVNVDLKNEDGQTPLLLAAVKGHEAVVKLLLSTGQANVNLKDKYGQTPLSQAAEKGHEAVVKLLLNTGQADVNSKDKYGQTPLSQAAEKGHEAVVKLLLNTGQADVNSKDKYGRTPLSQAAEKGHEAVITLLEEYAQSHLQPTSS